MMFQDVTEKLSISRLAATSRDVIVEPRGPCPVPIYDQAKVEHQHGRVYTVYKSLLKVDGFATILKKFQSLDFSQRPC
jgi:hypothetical protein